MNERRNRRLSAVLGVFLVAVAGGATVFLGSEFLARPVLAGQISLLGLAGVCDLVAAVDSPLTARWAWYRWSGLGNVLLGVALPLGFVGGGDELFFLVVTGVGGLSLAALGVDMIAFHGRYSRGERLDGQRSR